MKLAADIYRRLDRRLHMAWVELNRSTDTPDSTCSLQHLAGALRHIDALARELFPDTPPDFSRRALIIFLAGKYRHKVLGRENTPQVMDRLLARMEAMEAGGGHPAQAEDPLLITEAVPAIWRMIHGLRRDLRRRRPWTAYVCFRLR